MGQDDRAEHMEGKNNPRNLEGEMQAKAVARTYERWNRPFDPETADWIVELMSEEGRDLAGICNEPADFWPNGKRYQRVEIYSWMEVNPAFRRQVALARAAYADDTFGKIVKTVDKMTNDTVTVDREKIRAWQWIAKVTNPRAYGDKLDVSADVMTHTQGAQTLDVSHLTPEQRDSLRSLLLAARRANDTGEEDSDSHTIDGQAIDVTPKP